MKWVLYRSSLRLPQQVTTAQNVGNTYLLPEAASTSKRVPHYQPSSTERGRWFLTSTVGQPVSCSQAPQRCHQDCATFPGIRHALGWLRKTQWHAADRVATGNCQSQPGRCGARITILSFSYSRRGRGKCVIRTAFLAPNQVGHWHPPLLAGMLATTSCR